jgi:hypothetical protein
MGIARLAQAVYSGYVSLRVDKRDRPPIGIEFIQDTAIVLETVSLITCYYSPNRPFVQP